jgi:D-alanyl-lipoteichoic acid acyltransferase DltB (MBOAT superfamily)
MLFNSFGFLASFAAFVFLYYAVPKRTRWLPLLAVSFAFYATFDFRYVPLLAGVAAVAYLGGIALERADDSRRRLIFVLVTVLVLSALAAFKYLDFLADALSALLATELSDGTFPPRMNLVAVAGLSFYTFSAISYLADVYTRRIPAERHPGFFALYVAYFPKILAGPIERAQPFLTRLHGPAFDEGLLTSGLQLMLWGLFKKVVIADRLAVFVDAAYANAAFAAPADLLLATYFFAFQLYCDFSGYSDLAIGTSRVLGIDLMENFRRPYLSTSVPEFWGRRWHLSLAAWFRDYVYVPLGGSRVQAPRVAVNVLVVFLLSGLWHGAAWTFVVWGGLNGLFTVLTPVLARAGRFWPRTLQLPSAVRTTLAALLTFHLILVTWIFFRASSLNEALLVMRRVIEAGPVLPSLVLARIGATDIVVSIGLIVLLLVIEIADERRSMWARLERQPLAIRWAAYYALLAALVVLGTWNFEQFVYMQF